MFLDIQNPLNIIQEKTTVSSSLASGGSSVSVRNTDGISANDYVIIGKLGEETTELEQISTVSSATSLSLNDTVNFAHGIGSPISVIGYNQIEISYKTSVSGSFSVLDTIDIQVDSLATTYDDTSGQTSYYYRIRLYNSTTGQYSDYSPTLKGSGFSSKAVKPMINTILRRLRDKNAEYNSREDVLQEVIYQYEEVTSKLIQSSSEYYRKEIEIPTEAFKYEYALPSDFREVHVVKNGDGTTIEPLPNDIAGATGVPGYELSDTSKIYFNQVPTPATDDVSPTTILANNGSTENGTWSVGDDGTNLTDDADEYKVGVGSLNFDIDVSSDTDNKVTITNSTFTSVDLSSYEDTGKIRMWVYLPDVTYITNMDLRWGTDSSNYWELTGVSTDYKKQAFRDGWNLVQFDWADTNVTETSSPDDEDVGYILLTINYSSSQSDDTDFRLDAIRIANTFSGEDVYRLIYFRQPTAITNEMDELDIPPGNSSLLLDGAVAALMVGYENRDTLTRELLNRSDDKKSMFITQSSKRTRRPIGPRPYGRRRGYTRTGNFRSVNPNYDVHFPRD